MLINKKYLISLGLITCIFIPKIDLISIPGFWQGVRYEDLFLFAGFIYIFLRGKIFFYTIPGRKLYFIFFGVLFLYGIISLGTHGIESILLVLRWMEYSVFFMLLFHSSLNSDNIRKFIISYILINSIVVLLQYFEIIGGLYSTAYDPNVTSRYPGITGGAWELSAVLSLFTVSLIYDNNFKYYKKIIIIVISSILIFLSGTRTGMITFIIVNIFALLHIKKINFSTIILIILLGTLFTFNTRPVYYQKISNITAEPDPHYFIIGSDRAELRNEFSEIKIPGSLIIRAYGWVRIFRKMDFYDYLWGQGLGRTGLFADGMYSKILIDMGILGLLLFFFYYYNFLKSFKVIALVVLLFSVTLDFFSASKIMFALYLSVYYLSLMRDKPQENLVYRVNRNFISTQ